MAARLLADNIVLVLGGAGLVGNAIARRLALLKPQIRPRRIIVASRSEAEACAAVAKLEQEQEDRLTYIPNLQHSPRLEFVPEWGDVFVRSEFAHIPREELLANASHRRALLVDLYDNPEEAYERSYLVHILRKHRPEMLIDSINTATGLSYQNIFDAAFKVRQALHSSEESDENSQQLVQDTERMLLAQSVPALVRHIQILSKAAEEIGLENYMKIGTTGTGGMGLNLPFTHSESKPSNLILAKNETAFGHSGLLFLWSKTPGAPTVHEIKPGAAIGFRNMGVHSVSDRYGNEYIRKPRMQKLKLNGKEGASLLNVREDSTDYPTLGKLTTVAVDSGENGLLTADEFRTLTAPGSMELISPEEISEVCIQELMGIGTGHNVLSAMQGSILQPGYRAGSLRPAADRLLDELSHSSEVTMPSIALGRLGPPLLSKILFESHILKLQFGGEHGLAKLANCDPAELSLELATQVLEAAKLKQHVIESGTPSVTSLVCIAPTIGVPILLEQNVILRGPNITDPEPIGHDSTFKISTQDQIDQFAQRGWVDLRQRNLQVWKERARHILAEPAVHARDTSCLTGLHYGSESRELNPAMLASWIIAGELHGQRDLNTVTELDED